MKNRKRKNGTNRRYSRLVSLLIWLLSAPFAAFAQTGDVSGTVFDVANEPIIGASVLVKGTATGAITDLDGNFQLSAQPGATLVISYIGYRTEEVIAAPGKKIQVILQEDSEVLDEVVVVGFGTQKKVNLTGSVGLADAKDLESRPVVSATQALQGIVPGLQITTNTGEMDKDMKINIRGTGTIGEGSSVHHSY